MWKNTAERCRHQMTIWRMRVPCWITRATNTHLQYVILLFHCNNDCMNASHCYVICTGRVLFILRTAKNLSVSKLTCPRVDICTLSCRRFASFVVKCRFKDVSNKPWQDGETEGLVSALGHSSLNPASSVATQHSNGS